MTGIGAVLKSGKPRLSDCETFVEVVAPAGKVVGQLSWPAVGVELGFLYERCVGLHYEARGYTVDYRGLGLGFLDGGIDLIATK